MGTAGLRMPTAALACLPSALLICSGRRLVRTVTPRCLRRAARAVEDKTVITSGGSSAWLDLPAVALGPHRLVAFGPSFHWTDGQLVAETVGVPLKAWTLRIG